MSVYLRIFTAVNCLIIAVSLLALIAGAVTGNNDVVFYAACGIGFPLIALIFARQGAGINRGS